MPGALPPCGTESLVCLPSNRRRISSLQVSASCLASSWRAAASAASRIRVSSVRFWMLSLRSMVLPLLSLVETVQRAVCVPCRLEQRDHGVEGDLDSLVVQRFGYDPTAPVVAVGQQVLHGQHGDERSPHPNPLGPVARPLGHEHGQLALGVLPLCLGVGQPLLDLVAACLLGSLTALDLEHNTPCPGDVSLVVDPVQHTRLGVGEGSPLT